MDTRSPEQRRRIYDSAGNRLYLNAKKRSSFVCSFIVEQSLHQTERSRGG